MSGSQVDAEIAKDSKEVETKVSKWPSADILWFKFQQMENRETRDVGASANAHGQEVRMNSKMLWRIHPRIPLSWYVLDTGWRWTYTATLDPTRWVFIPHSFLAALAALYLPLSVSSSVRPDQTITSSFLQLWHNLFHYRPYLHTGPTWPTLPIYLTYLHDLPAWPTCLTDQSDMPTWPTYLKYLPDLTSCFSSLTY